MRSSELFASSARGQSAETSLDKETDKLHLSECCRYAGRWADSAHGDRPDDILMSWIRFDNAFDRTLVQSNREADVVMMPK